MFLQDVAFKERAEMPWYIYVLQFVSGLILANGVPHFVQGICRHRFPSPFASPPWVGALIAL